MPLTLGTLPITRYQVLGIGHQEANVEQGMTARSWTVTALLRGADVSSLSTIYTTWRTTRITEGLAEDTEVVGTTVPLSGTWRGLTWTNVGCWFTSAPVFEAVGPWTRASFGLVDAAQQLAVILRQKALDEEPEISYGTETIGTTVLTLLQPADGFADGPTATATATGTDLIEGALYAWQVKDIKGWTNSAGWTAIRAWYETAIAAVPASGVWFPVTPPSLEMDIERIAGVDTVRYIVSITLRRIR
jgi:hypothetical protein